MLRTGALVFLTASMVVLACTSGARHALYREQSSLTEQYRTVRRVAIVPNRLPLNLTDLEEWRRFNWRIAADEFTKAGFEVVDYDATKKTFEKSGLPVEDTMSSREKYAAFADELAVDLVVVPYYGTGMNSSTALLWSNYEWNSTVTFQIYRRDLNDFVARIDMEGFDTYVGGLLMTSSILVSLVAGEDGATAGLVVMGLGLIMDLSNTVFRTPDSHWRSDFDLAIREGLAPYLRTLKRAPVADSGVRGSRRIPTTPESSKLRCQSCGVLNEGDNRFCVGCGGKLKENLRVPCLGGSRPDAQVLQIQEKLKFAGFDPGPIDGVLGSQTSEAIREFQVKFGLEPTGLLDEPTLRQLMGE